MDTIINRRFYRIQSVETEVRLPLELSDGESYTHCAVQSLVVPKSYWMINTTATLTIAEELSTTTITFEPGNYSISSALYVLTAGLSACTADISVTYPDARYAAQDNRIRWVTTATITVACASEDLRRMLGLSATQTIESTFLSDAIEFQAYRQIYLISDMARNKDGLIQSIFTANDQYESNILFINPNPLIHCCELQPDHSELRLAVVDQYDQPINLHSKDWNAVIMLFNIAKTSELITEYIKYRVMS